MAQAAIDKPVSRFRRIIVGMLIVLLAVGAAGGVCYWQRMPPEPQFADVRYGEESAAQKLDIYLPKGKGPFPVVVYAHGGAFKFGDKRDISGDFKKNITDINGAGFALISINYRMSGEARFPAAVQDMKSAVRYARANATKYQLDADRIALWGKSAGGHIALMAGLASGVATFDDPRSRFANTPDNVSAIVSMYGPTDFSQMDIQLAKAKCDKADLTHNNADSPESLYLGKQITIIPELVQQSNPSAYLKAVSPPILLLHGAKDCTVPSLQSIILYDAATALMPKGRAQMEIVEGAVHGDAVFEGDGQMQRVIAFLRDSFATKSGSGQ
jgi:acetyl esterase/lipase